MFDRIQLNARDYDVEWVEEKAFDTCILTSCRREPLAPSQERKSRHTISSTDRAAAVWFTRERLTQ
jgi:hypothetical protein